MKRILILTFLAPILFGMNGNTAIINIPADYPTIQQGIEASFDGDTVLVQPGTYVENVNFNGHNIALGSLFLTTGDTSYISQTIIDGNSVGRVVTFENAEDNFTIITGLTIRNGGNTYSGAGIFCVGSDPTVYKNIITGNNSEQKGGGIFCDSSDAIIIDNLITENNANAYAGSGGGGIYCSSSNLTIVNNVIRGNSATGVFGGGGGGIDCFECNSTITNNVIIDNVSTFGGGIYCSVSDPIISNNTIVKNLAQNRGGGIYCGYNAPSITNTILWTNSAQDFNEIFADTSSNMTISYSNVQDTLWPGMGNISVDPFFRDSAGGDFHLMSIVCGDSANSPCIDAGDPAILDSLLDCSWGLGGLRSDMGAYGGGDSTTVGIVNTLPLPGKFNLMQNYPNPFNAQTTIRFLLPQPQNVRLAVYDLLGRMVETLVQGVQPAGYHQVLWEAEDQPAGLYFYRIRAGEYTETRKMVLLK